MSLPDDTVSRGLSGEANATKHGKRFNATRCRRGFLMNGKITMKKKLGPDGEWIEYNTYSIDGKEVTEAEFLAIWPDKEIVGVMTTPPGNYPHESMALGCHPRQVKEAQAYLEKVGLPTDHTPDGKMIFRDRGHRRDVLRHYGYHDNNACGRV